MAKQDERFIKVLNEGSTWTTNREIWVDKTTGVNYLWIVSGSGGGNRFYAVFADLKLLFALVR